MAAITTAATTALAAVTALAAFAALEATFATLFATFTGAAKATFARTALAAEITAATFAATTFAAETAIAATATTAMPALAFALGAFARTTLLAGAAGGRGLRLAAEEALQPAEETAGLRGGGCRFRSSRTIRTGFGLRATFALGAVVAFGPAAFFETTGSVTAVAFGTALATVVAEAFAAAFAALEAAFTALAAIGTTFATLATAFPPMIGGLARGRGKDVELGLLGRSDGSCRGHRSNRGRGGDRCSGNRARCRSRRRGDGSFGLRGFIDHRGRGCGRGGYFSLGSRGRSGLGDGSDRRRRRRGDGSGSRGSGLGLGRSKTADITGQRDHGDRRRPVERLGGGLRRGSGDGLAFTAREAGTTAGSEGRSRRRDRGGFCLFIHI